MGCTKLSMCASALAVAGLAFLSAKASANVVTWDLQTRYVRAIMVDTQEQTAPDFSPFTVSLARDYPSGSPTQHSGASQTSSLALDRSGNTATINAVGSSYVQCGDSMPAPYGISHFEVGFVVNQGATYNLSVALTGSHSTFSLTGPAGFTTVTSSGSGVLAPGYYRLTADSTESLAMSAQSDYNVALNITDPAPLPEPGGLLVLLPAGLLCLRRRRVR